MNNNSVSNKSSLLEKLKPSFKNKIINKKYNTLLIQEENKSNSNLFESSHDELFSSNNQTITNLDKCFNLDDHSVLNNKDDVSMISINLDEINGIIGKLL